MYFAQCPAKYQPRDLVNYNPLVLHRAPTQATDHVRFGFNKSAEETTDDGARWHELARCPVEPLTGM